MPKTLVTRLQLLIWEDGNALHVIGGKCEPPIHPSVLSKYATGKKDISLKHLRALRTYFDVPAEQIIGDVEVDLRLS